MENKKLKSIMQDALEKEISPAQIELWPDVKNRLVARKHPLFRQGENMNTTLFIRRTALATLALMIAVSLMAFTPQGRALAQGILQFFARAETDTLPAQPTYETISESPRILNITAAEDQAGFDVLEPAFLPAGFVFQGASYTAEINTVIQQFGYAPEDIRLSIQQQPFTTLEACYLCGLVGASAPVDAVQIDTATGEYAEGVWELTDAGPVWHNDPYLKTLRWQEDGMAFEMIFMGMELSKADLLAIAESLK